MAEIIEVKQVPFLGSELVAAKDEDGNIWAGVRWMCDGLGLSEGQRKRQIANIQEDEVLSKGGSNLILPTKGGKQDTLCLKLDYVPLWLAKISVTPTMKQDNPGLAEHLIAYQLNAKDVLAAAFLPNSVAPPPKPAVDGDAWAKAILMDAKRQMALEYRKLYDAAGIKPEHQIMALQNFIGEDGPRLPAKALEETKVTYDKGAIAKKVGVYAQVSGNPHAQAIGAIISMLDILPKEIEVVPRMRSKHGAFDIRFTESVIDKVWGWIVANGKPNSIQVNNKKYKVVYKECEK